MKTGIRFVLLTAVWGALGMFMGTAEVAAFPLLRDTIDLRANPPENVLLLRNATPDSIVIDSISAVRASIVVPSEGSRLSFNWRRGSGPTGQRFGYFHADLIHPDTVRYLERPRIVIPAGDSLELSAFAFGYCYFCPLAKSASSSAVNDPLGVRLMFHSGSLKDSVLFLSRERPSSSLAPAAKAGGLSLKTRPLDAKGRALRGPSRNALSLPPPR